MSLSFPNNLRLALLSALLAAPAFGCGPFFPVTVIDRGDAALLTPLGRSFSASLERLPLPPPTFPHVALDSLEAERLDLIAAGASAPVLARHAELRAALAILAENRLNGAPPAPATARPPAFPGAPVEFALYLRGAHHWLSGQPDAARAAFLELLALPPAKRPYKSTWAAFSLGQLAHADPAEAARRFAETRALASAGFSDTAGLANASLGLEARHHYTARAWAPAAELYLQHHANNDPSALNSLLFTLAAALEDDAPDALLPFVRSPRLRPLLAARILATPYPTDSLYVTTFNRPAARRWLELLEAAKLPAPAEEAETFALVAYRVGALDEARRWLALAPENSAPARWLRAKLALLDGRIDDALPVLSALVREPAAALADYHADALDRVFNFPDRPAAQTLQGELGALRLARRDYLEATRLLLEGGYWADAAYIAERVLTANELRDFVGGLPATTPDLAALRLLLARRLVREHRPAEARPLFTPELQLQLDAYLAHLQAGADSTRPALARGRDLFAAARILRHEGIALRGTELAPDHAIWGGSFHDVGPALATRLAAGGALAPTADEITRATIPAALPDVRFHYRPLAAELAWQASTLYPDNHDELASLLAEAGGWLKARDPRSADRFYKALVTRCPATTLGRAADQKRWFP